MPVLPQIRETTGVSTIQFPSRPASTVFKSISDTAQVFADIQEASDQTEADRVIAEKRAELGQIIKLNNATIGDPGEFETKSIDDVNELRLRLEGLSPRVRKLAEDSLSDDFIRVDTDIKFGKFGKLKDKAVANFIRTKAALVEAAATSNDPNEINRSFQLIGAGAGKLKAAGFFDEKDVAQQIESYGKGVNARRLQIGRQQRIEETRQRRIVKEEQKEARGVEFRNFSRLLREDKLTIGQVENSPNLEISDVKFFTKLLEKDVTARTDPRTAVEIENLLSSFTETVAEGVERATTAKALIDGAIDQGTLSKTDILAFTRRANEMQGGGEPDKDRWFNVARNFLKDQFGFNKTEQRFMALLGKQTGANHYWDIMSQLMQEQEDKGLQGRALFDRAKELAKPKAIDFWSDQAEQPSSGEDELPDPVANKGRVVRDTNTGVRRKSDGKKWNVIQGTPKG